MTGHSSQTVDSIKDTEYVVHAKHGNEIILYNTEQNTEELWVENEHFAGYVVEVDGRKYEFVRTLTEEEAMRIK